MPVAAPFPSGCTPLYAIDQHQCTVGDPQGGRDLGREVHVSRGVDQVDDESAVIGVVRLVIKGYGRRFDGDAAFLFVLSCIHLAGIPGSPAGYMPEADNKESEIVVLPLSTLAQWSCCGCGCCRS